MSLMQSSRMREARKGHSSAAEILACFEQEKERFLRLALVITGDSESAKQSFLKARETVLQGRSPSCERLAGWSKWLTINFAISRSYDAISSCGPHYSRFQCTHPEHLVQTNDSKLQKQHELLFRMDPRIIVASLDALSRAVLILRTTARASILDCTQQLDLSPNTVMAANCRAMSWLFDMQQRSPVYGKPVLSPPIALAHSANSQGPFPLKAGQRCAHEGFLGAS